MFVVKINAELCKSCQYCLVACKRNVLGIADSGNTKGYRYIYAQSPENCIGCKMCAIMCPDAAIEIYKED